MPHAQGKMGIVVDNFDRGGYYIPYYFHCLKQIEEAFPQQEVAKVASLKRTSAWTCGGRGRASATSCSSASRKTCLPRCASFC